MRRPTISEHEIVLLVSSPSTLLPTLISRVLVYDTMIDLGSLAIVLVLCASLSFMSWRFRLLTADGATAAFAAGFIIGGLGSLSWLVILIIFTLLGFAVTRYKIRLKMKRKLQEGKRGERTYRNVLANGLVPAIIAIVYWLSGSPDDPLFHIVFLSSLSTAAADTIASELGILDSRVWLITSFEKVEPGTNGGISILGTIWAAAASLVTALIGWLIIYPCSPLSSLLLIPVAMGFIGCMADSVIGATLERRGAMTKLGTNIASMGIGSIIGFIIALPFV